MDHPDAADEVEAGREEWRRPEVRPHHHDVGELGKIPGRRFCGLRAVQRHERPHAGSEESGEAPTATSGVHADPIPELLDRKAVEQVVPDDAEPEPDQKDGRPGRHRHRQGGLGRGT